MTREELINSKEYKIISAAVDWYQDHQDADALDGFEAGYEAAIDKACIFLEKIGHKYMVEVLKKAMEE